MNYRESAAALIAGGWTSENGEQLKQKYNLTDRDVYHLTSAMKQLEYNEVYDGKTE